MKRNELSGFDALRRIVSGAVGGALVAAIMASTAPLPNPSAFLFIGASIGSFVGYVSTFLGRK